MDFFFPKMTMNLQFDFECAVAIEMPLNSLWQKGQHCIYSLSHNVFLSFHYKIFANFTICKPGRVNTDKSMCSSYLEDQRNLKIYDKDINIYIEI